MYENIKLIAMDLDGTLTQHKTTIDPQQRQVLTQLSQRYQLLMVGAGQARRIFSQLDRFPLDILGNYGMQYARYDEALQDIVMERDDSVPCDRESVTRRVAQLRQAYGYTEFAGEGVEYHPSGCVTIPLLGTKAALSDKLRFDPDRAIRRAFYQDVIDLFPEFRVFLGGTSSFDMAPNPYNKYHALDRYCAENGLTHDQVAYIGDDYSPGGNDEPVYRSDFVYLPIDNYRDFPKVVAPLLEAAGSQE